MSKFEVKVPIGESYLLIKHDSFFLFGGKTNPVVHLKACTNDRSMFSDKVMAFKVSNGNQDMHTVLLVLKSECC